MWRVVLSVISFCYNLKIKWCFVILAIFNSAVLASQADSVLVDIQWLVEHQNDVNIKIVDARSEAAYKAGHIEGAVNIPVADTFNPVINTDRVGNLKYISTLFSKAGVRKEHTIVVYDGNTYIDAGRVFWVFELYGHKNVKLLDGGIKGWQAYSNQALSKKITSSEKSNYIPTIEPRRLITKFSMRLAIDDDEKLIIDARSKQEYVGNESIALRSGHIPGAISIPWDQNFIEIDGIRMLKPIDSLKAIYDKKVNGKKVYLYCNKGRQSSFSYTILRQLGHDVAHYDGSWFEWGNDESLPIENN